jgi:hypothetical protein
MEAFMNKEQLSPLNDYAGDQKNIENLAGLLKPILDLPPTMHLYQRKRISSMFMVFALDYYQFIIRRPCRQARISR